MAGAKETPRQKLINLMYLVLLAMLALQVSSAIIEKFQSLNQSIEAANIDASVRSNELMQQINLKVENNKNNPKDVALQDKARLIKKHTSELVKYLQNSKAALIEKTGGYNEEGGLVGAKEEEEVAQYMLGPGESKDGEGYDMQNRINEYVNQLNDLMREAKIETSYHKIALDGKQDPAYKDHKDHSKKTFAQLNFDATPLVAALSVISEKESAIRAMELNALSLINNRIGGDNIPIDKIRPIVQAQSQYVVAGMEYDANMFMAAYSSSYTPKMTLGENQIDVDQLGSGKVNFRASAGNFNEQGLAKKTWKGTITYPKADGTDSTYIIEQDYYVVKPSIDVKSAAIQRLYKHCGNKLDIQVPALGPEYQPEFSGAGARLINEGVSQVTVVPNQNRVKINVKNKGVQIGSVKYQAVPLPAPLVKLKVGNRDVDPIQGVTTSTARRLYIEIKAEKDLQRLLPRDTRYRIKNATIQLARGKTGSAPVRFNSQNMSQKIRALASNARPNERFIIELIDVERKNFLNQWMPVKNLNERIFQVYISN